MSQPQSIVTSNRSDRWGYDKDFGIVIDAFDNSLPCPANADQLVQDAITRMGRTEFPPQFERFLLDYKADSWLDLVTTTIPALQTQIQGVQPQVQALQAQNVALQTQIVAAQPQTQALQTQIANLQTQIQALQTHNDILNTQNQMLQNQNQNLQNNASNASQAPNLSADAVYGPPPQIPDNAPQREEITINITDANQGQHTLLMESLVNEMADLIRHRVIDNLPGRLKAWLKIADGRKKVVMQATNT